MSTPPLMLACAALFWGWQSDGAPAWLVALAAGALLEAPRLAKRRFALGPEEFNRVSDFCTLLVAGVAVLLYLNYGNPRAVTLLFQWLPIVLLPLALSQAWSTSPAIPLSALFWGLRRQPERRPRSLDVSWPCLAVWLLGASAANQRTGFFYPGLLAFCAWALAARRPRSFAPAACAALLVVAGAIGYAGQLGLQSLQQWLEGAVPEWLAGGGSRTDPYRSSTDIGTLGEIKRSDAIVLRVEQDADAKRPLLLHRASYDHYRGGTWIARGGRFVAVHPEREGDWPLLTGDAPSRLRIHEFSPRGNPVLSLPSGTLRLLGMDALGMRRHELGAVQAERPPGHFGYEALVDADRFAESAPGDFDLRLPQEEAGAIREIAAQLAPGAPPAEALAAVRGLFSASFSYSLYRPEPSGRATPLAQFLLATRSGHCEYFATATVLLLRALGVPARYATGFSVQEYSKLEGIWIARERHAHAWARAWIDGRWVDVDTTPPDWARVEAAQASAWSAVFDVASWLRFAGGQWLARTREETLQRWGAGLALALVAVLAWRLRRKGAVVQASRASGGRDPARGSDSEFYGVERRLSELGWRRDSAEPMHDWIARLEREAPLEPDTLRRLLRLHYRLRFDPAGLDTEARGELRAGSISWLERHRA